MLTKDSGSIAHLRFRDLPNLLKQGDCLVFNDTRVYPARIQAYKLSSGGKIEILLLRRLGEGLWRALIRGRGIRLGTHLQLLSREYPIRANVVAVGKGGQRDLQFERPILSLLSSLGEVPLPPYIQHKIEDPERYQTIYSKNLGSAASPTAGLHFTAETFEALKQRGVHLAFCTLHIGLDTFQPVRVERIADHSMHSEYVELSDETAAIINRSHSEGGRIISIGTTSARALETAAQQSESGAIVSPFQGNTQLFIRPGHGWQAVDALLTNFHLPRSTLLMLVSAPCGSREYSPSIHRGDSRTLSFLLFW